MLGLFQYFVFVFACVIIFVFVILVRLSNFISLHLLLFKNIAHDGSFCGHLLFENRSANKKYLKKSKQTPSISGRVEPIWFPVEQERYCQSFSRSSDPDIQGNELSYHPTPRDIWKRSKSQWWEIERS